MGEAGYYCPIERGYVAQIYTRQKEAWDGLEEKPQPEPEGLINHIKVSKLS